MLASILGILIFAELRDNLLCNSVIEKVVNT